MSSFQISVQGNWNFNTPTNNFEWVIWMYVCVCWISISETKPLHKSPKSHSLSSLSLLTREKTKHWNFFSSLKWKTSNLFLCPTLTFCAAPPWPPSWWRARFHVLRKSQHRYTPQDWRVNLKLIRSVQIYAPFILKWGSHFACVYVWNHSLSSLILLFWDRKQRAIGFVCPTHHFWMQNVRRLECLIWFSSFFIIFLIFLLECRSRVYWFVSEQFFFSYWRNRKMWSSWHVRWEKEKEWHRLGKRLQFRRQRRLN